MPDRIPRRTFVTCAAGASLAAIPTCTAASAGTRTHQFQSDAGNTGRVSEVPAEVGVKWRSDIGDQIIASPVFADGTVFVGASDAGLVAVDAETGEVEWETSDVSTVGATAAVRDETVVGIGWDGTVFGANRETGAIRWQHDGVPRTREAIAVHDRVAYVLAKTQLLAIDLDSGMVRWRREFDAVQEYLPAVSADRIVVASGSVVQSLTSDGTRDWKRSIEGPIRASPTLANGTVFVGAGDTAGRLYALDAETGAERWWTAVDGIPHASAGIDESTVYLISTDGQECHAQAVDASTGDVRWSSTLAGGTSSAPLVDDRSLVFGAHDGTVRCLNTSDGSMRWSVDANAAVGATSLAIGAGRLYAASEDGALLGLDPSASSFGVPGFGALAALTGLGGYAHLNHFANEEESDRS